MKQEKIVESLSLEEKAKLTTGKNFWESTGFPSKGVPSIFFSDGPHGIRKQALAADHLGLNESLKATCFPTAVTMASSWDVSLGERMGIALGEEALAQKVNVLLGPGMNIKRNPLCGRNFEYFSEDPYLAGKMAASYVRGIQSNGISACLKHFACNNQEERRMTIDTVVDERALREIYLTGFEIAVKEGKPMTIMSSYNRLNGTYTNENPHLMSILRKEWGYDGVVVTDWGGENDRVAGLKAGNEIEMPGSGLDTIHRVMSAVEDKTLNVTVLDECIDRFVDLAVKTSEPFADGKKHEQHVEAHNELARECAEGSMVLLKNEGKILPLEKGARVAIVGDFARKPRYQGAGSSIVNCTKLVSALDVVNNYDINFIGYEKGFHRFGRHSKKLLRKAVKLAKTADVTLVYLGLDEAIEAEGLDRKNMEINQNQVMLLKALKEANCKVVAILHAGSAVTMPWADDCDALLNAFLPGQAGAEAEFNILTGKVNPSGKLAETYPFEYNDTPTHKYFPGKAVTTEYRDSIFVGYRYYQKIEKKVRFPFGFGLSYSEFEYHDLRIEAGKGVYFKIKNTSKVEGKEIAQLYIRKPYSSVYRPDKELKGFIKVDLKAGEEKEVFIPFDEYSFRVYDMGANAWRIEKGRYSIMIASNSEDVRLSAEIDLDGNELNTAGRTQKDVPDYFFGKIDDIKDEEFAKILGHDVPKSSYTFLKKNRMLVHYNTTVWELKYAKGWAGRFFSRAIRFAIWLLKAFGDVKTSNTLIMGMLHQPMRGISRMTGGSISWGQLDGLIEMFNGHFFKGLHHFFKEGRKNKKRAKEAKKAEAKKEE